jgi:hypothetical protein
MNPIGLGLVEAMTEVAQRLAVKHDLIRDDGKIACWKCKRVPALMPSLHCAACLQAHRDWNAGGAAHTVNAQPRAEQKTKGAEEPKPRLPGSVRTPGTGETSSALADPEQDGR